MFTALHTLADVTAKRAPLSSSTIAEPGSPSDMDINSSSDEYTPPSLLFKIDLEDEEEAPPLLPLIDDLFNQNKPKPKYQQVKLPLVKNLTNITPTNSLWSINHKEVMSMLTKAIDDSSKRSPRHLYEMYLQLKQLADTDWSAPPYEDWMPSQRTWDNAQPPCLTTPSSTTLVSSEDEDEDPQIGILDAWPSPPPSPIHSNGMHPLNIKLSRENPRELWIFNTIGSPDYFRLLIPDPAMPREQIITPWIKYNLTIAQPEITSTFGKNYPITL